MSGIRPAPGHLPPPPKIKIKRNEGSLLGVAEKKGQEELKAREDPPPKKLAHVTVDRVSATRPARRPPTRKPMVERITPLQIQNNDEDISLVAEKKPPPSDLKLSVGKVAEVVVVKPKEDEATLSKKKEIEAIEKAKRKSSLQSVGSKTVMRIFLDNNGVGFKTLQVPNPCTVYNLVEIMKKKLEPFTDAASFGIWEVRDKLDVRLIPPDEDVHSVMEEWKEDVSFKFVFKRAHGEVAKLYINYNPNATKKATGSYIDTSRVPLPQVLPKGLSLPMIKKPQPESEPVPIVEEKPQQFDDEPANNSGSPLENGVFSPESKRRIAPGRPAPKRAINTSAPTTGGSGGGTLRTPPINRPPPGSNLRPTTPGASRPPQKPAGGPPTPPQKPSSMEQIAPIAKPTPVIVETVILQNEIKELQEIEASKGPTKSYQSKNIMDWSIEEVGEWISDLGFEKMKNCFIENYISGKELADLQNDELKDDLGVTALGARKAILREIQILLNSNKN